MGLDMNFYIKNKETGERKNIYYFDRCWPLFHLIEEAIGPIENSETYSIKPETLKNICIKCHNIVHHAFKNDYLDRKYFKENERDAYDYLDFLRMIEFVCVHLNNFTDFDENKYEILFWPDW